MEKNIQSVVPKNTKVIYVYPDCGEDIDWFESLSADEKLHVAKNSNDFSVYNSLDDFKEAFNSEHISDLGFIYFIY